MNLQPVLSYKNAHVVRKFNSYHTSKLRIFYSRDRVLCRHSDGFFVNLHRMSVFTQLSSIWHINVVEAGIGQFNLLYIECVSRVVVYQTMLRYLTQSWVNHWQWLFWHFGHVALTTKYHEFSLWIIRFQNAIILIFHDTCLHPTYYTLFLFFNFIILLLLFFIFFLIFIFLPMVFPQYIFTIRVIFETFQ